MYSLCWAHCEVCNQFELDASQVSNQPLWSSTQCLGMPGVADLH